MTHQLISCAAIEQTGMIWDERTLTTLFIRVKDIDIFPRKKRRDNKLEEWQSFRSNPALGHGPWQHGKAQTRTLTEAKPCTRKTGFPLGFPSGLHLSLTSIRISHFYSLLGCLKTNGPQKPTEIHGPTLVSDRSKFKSSCKLLPAGKASDRAPWILVPWRAKGQLGGRHKHMNTAVCTSTKPDFREDYKASYFWR